MRKEGRTAEGKGRKAWMAWHGSCFHFLCNKSRPTDRPTKRASERESERTNERRSYGKKSTRAGRQEEEQGKAEFPGDHCTAGLSHLSLFNTYEEQNFIDLSNMKNIKGGHSNIIWYYDFYKFKFKVLVE